MRRPLVNRSSVPASLAARLTLGASLGLAALAGSTGCATLEVTEIKSTTQKPSNVAVYFKVTTNQGEPVPSLTAESFNIYEDEQLVSPTESQQVILNPEVAASHYTLLLVDMSGSVSESDDVSGIVSAADSFADRVESNNVVAIYAFDGNEDLHKLSDFRKAQEGDSRAEKIASFKPDDPSTNLNGAVVKGIELLDEELEKSETPLKFGTLVIFTDGTDRAARVTEEEMMESVNESDHDIFAIGLGSEISEEQLNRIGKDGTAMAADQSAVDQAFETIAAKIEGMTKSYYLLSYCSPARAREHEVEIEAVVKNEDDKTAKGSLVTNFSAEGFEKGCDPNTPPKFDVTKGDEIADKPANAKGGGKGSGKASASVGK